MFANLYQRKTPNRRTTYMAMHPQSTQINQQQSEQSFNMGKEHMLNKQYEKALEHYFNALMHDPTSYKAYCNMGVTYRQLGELKQAQICYQRALQIKNDDLITLYNYGNTLRILGNCEEAIQLYQQVVSSTISSQAIHLHSLINMGVCYKIMQQYEEAIEVFDRAISINASEESSIFNKGMCLLKLIISTDGEYFQILLRERCNQAETLFQRVLQLNPHNVAAKIALIEITYYRHPEKSKYEAAITAFQAIDKSMTDKPTIQFINTKIGYCLACLKEYQKSSKHYNMGNIAKNSNSIRDSIKRQTLYDDFPKRKKERPGSQKNKKRIVDKKGRPSSAKKEYSIDAKNIMKKKKNFTQLFQEEKFEEAFDIIKDMEQGIQKYQNHIFLSYKEAQLSGNDFYLSSALRIYKQKILNNNPEKQITLNLCSIKCHQIITEILNYYEQYEQATKHYNVLSEYFRDQKLTPQLQQQMKIFYENRGQNFAVRGLHDRAIEEFQKGIELDPNNFSFVRGLGRTFIDQGRVTEAQKFFQDYLQKLNPKKQKQKVIFVDCLLNIADCERNQEKQFDSLNKALTQLEKYFPTLKDVLDYFDQTIIEGMYLRRTDLFEEKYYKNAAAGKEKEVRQKLLALYLSCLKFPSCPDREGICINCGNLLFLNQEYSNALAFYQKLSTNKQLIANNMGLAFAYLSQGEQALSCLEYALDLDPQNTVYQINYAILKWMYGIKFQEGSSGQISDCLQKELPYVLQTQTSHRVAIGMEMIQSLTSILSKCDNRKVAGEIRGVEMINQIIKTMKESTKPQIKFGLNSLQKENQSFGSKPLSFNLIEQMLYEPKVESFIKEYKEKALEPINHLQKHPDLLTSVQFLFSLSTFCMASPQSHQLLLELIDKESTPTFIPVHCSTPDFKQNPEPYLKRVIKISDPNRDLNIKNFLYILFEQQCILESSVNDLKEIIEKKYYDSAGILDQIKIDRMAPTTYDSFQSSTDCLLKTFQCMSKVARVSFRDRKICKESNIKGLKDKYVKIFNSEFHSLLKEGKTQLYNEKTQNLTIEFNDSSLPITIKTSHETWQEALKFVNSLGLIQNQPFPNHNSLIGIQPLIINKKLIVELQWGCISVFQSYLTLINHKDLNPILVSVFQIGEIENIINDQIESLTREQKRKIVEILKAKYIIKGD